jgi:hypothetical protein
MSRTFEHYRASADRIDGGWTQRQMTDDHGGVCLVQGLMIGTGQAQLSEEVVADVHAELCRNPFYLLMQALTFMVTLGHKGCRRAVRIGKFMAWNDMPWRRKKTVVMVLRVLAAKSELSWRRSNSELLHQAIARQQADAARFAESADQRELMRLEDELSSKWAKLARQDEYAGHELVLA